MKPQWWSFFRTKALISNSNKLNFRGGVVAGVGENIKTIQIFGILIGKKQLKSEG